MSQYTVFIEFVRVRQVAARGPSLMSTIAFFEKMCSTTSVVV